MSEKKEEKGKPVEEKTASRKVRILATDIDSSKSLVIGLSKIRGVGYNFAHAVVSAIGYDKNKKLADLSEQEIEALEKAINDPASLKIPSWIYNRRRDLETGKDLHLTTSDLLFARKSDIDLLGEIKSYKGLRHARGLKVRGQRTASTGRGKAAVGVQRKKSAPAKKK